MKQALLFLFAFTFFAAGHLGAQEVHTGFTPGQKTFKPYLAFNTAFSYSVINNRKEVRGQYKPGIEAGVSLFTSPWFAIAADYTWFFPHYASPSFVNIHSWNTELNCNFFMGVGQTDLKFKALFGASYLDWQGTFIGPSLNDNNKYYYGLLVRQHWIAANLGCGFSHVITGNLNGSIDFRTRFASEKKDLVSISDTAFTFGMTWEMKGSSAQGRDDHRGHRKTTKKRSGRLYKWLKTGA